jgi:hypothetical protein
MNVHCTAEYHENEGRLGVTLHRESLDSEEVKDATLGVAESVQDYCALFPFFRTLDTEVESAGVFMCLISILGMEVGVRWKVEGEEIVRDVPCTRIAANVGGRGHYIWVEREEPNRLVRFEDPGRRMRVTLRGE